SFFMVLTTTRMRPRVLGTVNFVFRVFGKAQAQVRVRKNVGNDAYCIGAIRVAVVHERSPFEATHDDVRLGSMRRPVGYRRESVPRPLTIYAGSLESVSGWRIDRGCVSFRVASISAAVGVPKGGGESAGGAENSATSDRENGIIGIVR